MSLWAIIAPYRRNTRLKWWMCVCASSRYQGEVETIIIISIYRKWEIWTFATEIFHVTFYRWLILVLVPVFLCVCVCQSFVWTTVQLFIFIILPPPSVSSNSSMWQFSRSIFTIPIWSTRFDTMWTNSTGCRQNRFCLFVLSLDTIELCAREGLCLCVSECALCGSGTYPKMSSTHSTLFTFITNSLQTISVQIW